MGIEDRKPLKLSRKDLDDFAERLKNPDSVPPLDITKWPAKVPEPAPVATKNSTPSSSTELQTAKSRELIIAASSNREKINLIIAYKLLAQTKTQISLANFVAGSLEKSWNIIPPEQQISINALVQSMRDAEEPYLTLLRNSRGPSEQLSKTKQTAIQKLTQFQSELLVILQKLVG